MRLTKHFYLREFTHSETAARMGREVEVPDELVDDLKLLCERVLEPLRVDLKRAIFVISGYRPPWLNRAVGGSKASQHMIGQAADFIVSGMTPMQACRRIVALDLPFDQLILEFDRWVHVSVNERPRGKVLTARKINGQTVYSPGLVEAP